MQETKNPMGDIRETEKARKLQKTISERARLFYYDYAAHEIKRDVTWLRNLKVREVYDIEITYTLKTTCETKIISVATCIKGNFNDWILYITPNSGPLENSQQLARSIYQSNKRKDVFNINAILTTPLSNLESMYPVDCMPNLQNADGGSGRYRSGSHKPRVIKNQKLRDALRNGINACRSNSVIAINTQNFTRIADEVHPNYCDVTPGMNNID